MNKQVIPSGVTNFLWGKMPMQDDPIHLRCDSALATNEYSYHDFFLYEIWKRGDRQTYRYLPVVPRTRSSSLCVSTATCLHEITREHLPVTREQLLATREEHNTKANIHIHKWFRIRSKSNILMQLHKIHQHIGKNQDSFIESNRVQEDIQPIGLQPSISFPAEWNSFFNSFQSITHPIFLATNQHQFFENTKFQPP